MQGTFEGGTVRVGGDARQRFYDARGYGRPLDGNRIELAPVEAAHLLFRGDLDGVVGPDGETMAFRAFLTAADAVLTFVVYKDLRDRGFYLSPTREGWVDDPAGADLVVYPRGKGPADDEVAHRVRVAGEREEILAADLGDVVLAVVDEEGELTYFETERIGAAGDADAEIDRYDPPTDLDAALLADRAVVWDPPADLHDRGFYGQRLHGRNAESGPLQLSLVEAAYLARRGALGLPEPRVVERGRQVEGERFDRRLRAYAALRAAGSVPKSGFKFGADFRTYDGFTTVSEMDHSTRLIRVVSPAHTFLPRDLSLDVRLAGGVRKRMVFALTDVNEGIDWLSVARLTP
ncbi:endonuclease [Haloplanus rubicundus]|uniref:tRNA-splicing endonuclease n=1 Tax=Haloplanus rubicundus TaxID=1547898 RepID=A0A345E090_9EURY|nr:tRNA-intron lyase [Haloplanus rubicundus]AXG05612.1 endonuclease [Haloplanus rubicundus]